MGTAVKTYEFEEGSVEGGGHRITVRRNGRKVVEYARPTMEEAQRAFASDGFQPVAWAEGRRIVLQGED